MQTNIKFVFILLMVNVGSLVIWNLATKFPDFVEAIIRLSRNLSRGKMGFPRKKVCERIKQIRFEVCGRTHGAQKNFSRLMGIKYTTYRDYELKTVDLDFCQKISDTLPYSLNWILTGQGSKKKE